MALIKIDFDKVVALLDDQWWIAMLSLLVALAVTPLVRWVAYKTRIVDKPDDLLKPHSRPIAYLGGVAICIALLTGLAAFLAVMPDRGHHWQRLGQDMGDFEVKAVMNNPIWELGAIMLACLLITVVGLVDDLLSIRPRTKVLGQVAAAGLLFVGGVSSRMAIVALAPLFALVGLVPPEWLVYLLSAIMSVVLVVATCNATNLLDGLDGLCGGVTAIITVGFLALAVWLAMWQTNDAAAVNSIRLALCLAMVGAVIGFLPYNLPPATIFMGDAGSMLLGFFVAVMMSFFCREGTVRWLLAAVVIFALPIVDTGLAVVRRFLAGKNIFEGDRSHLYDQLVDRGMSVKKVVLLFYVFAFLSALAGVGLFVFMRTRYGIIVVAVLATVTVWILHRKGMIKPKTRR